MSNYIGHNAKGKIKRENDLLNKVFLCIFQPFFFFKFVSKIVDNLSFINSFMEIGKRYCAEP